MIPASYVKPYVARQKNDAADAAAICEAVTRHALEAQMRRHCRAEPEAGLLSVPGVGPITVSAILAEVPDIRGFRSGRDLAAWLGLVPRQNSSGGKERLGRIKKMGDRTIRRLLVIGAMSMTRWWRGKQNFAQSWLGRIIARKPIQTRCSRPGQQNGEVIWAVMT
ncbi:transposase [Bradyrhizobium sp. SBR1B]|nr:transposase [Bradyrhizobium sp. SBR1B]